MEIIFEGPTFFSSEDENKFFEWVYSLPSYKEVIGAGNKLHLNLTEPVDSDTVIDLLIIFRRWQIDTINLEKLKNRENEHALWHQTIESSL